MKTFLWLYKNKKNKENLKKYSWEVLERLDVFMAFRPLLSTQ